MLHFETEYRVGRRARFSRTYRGFPALVAILMMSGLTLAFGIATLVVTLIVFVLRSVWLILVAVATMIAAILSAPFRAARMLARRAGSPRPALKPAWIAIDDVA